MTVEERHGSSASKGGGAGGGPNGRFPVGMRVLAVDDDPVCLKLLETLLRRCQYHVTATNQAVVALKLLRENKDKFDLVISDVHMPDMDGFKLLELVGLEMDLPVIMLSANSDPKAVMQGITHGACDYLLKPVRIEELKNIWQHVVRRWKFDPKDLHNYDHGDEGDKPRQSNSEDGRATHSDRSGRLNRKRKDQNGEDDDDCGDSGHENDDDPSAQKKPRVVWTVDLHRKFVAAVNQLGIDKAMPKRILDLMNDGKLTRENVASHLQKYRLYLKRISIANQQARIAAALGMKDAKSTPMGYFDSRQNYLGFARSEQLSTLASFQQGNMLGSLKSKTYSEMFSISSSGAIQLGHSQNRAYNTVGDTGKLSSTRFSGMTQTNSLQGAYTSSEFNQLQQQKAMFQSSNPRSRELSETGFSISTPDSSFLRTVNNNQMLRLLLQQQQQSLALVTPHSAGLTSLRAAPFEMTKGASSYLPDLGRCNDNWPAAAPSSWYPLDPLPSKIPSSQETLASNDSKGCDSLMTSSIDLDQCTDSNAHLLCTVMGSNFNSQMDLLVGNTLNMSTSRSENPGLSDIISIDYAKLDWQEQRQNQMQKSNLVHHSSDPMGVNYGLIDAAVVQDTGLINKISYKMVDPNMINQPHFSNPSYPQKNSVGRTSSSDNIIFHDEYISDPTKLQGALKSNGYTTFDDLVNAMTKREREDVLMDGDTSCDIYSLGTCM